MTRIRSVAVGLLASLLTAACDGPTAVEAPFVPDAANLARATVIHIDSDAQSVSASLPTSGARANLSILGRDAIEARATQLTRTRFNNKKDLVRFDLAIVNTITGHELRAPSGIAAPPAAASVFAFPYSVQVTSGSGDVEPSDDWAGTAFNFFGSAACHGKTACFPWEAFAAPLRPGQASLAQSVGFLVDRGVTAFDVYVLVAADIVSIPTGVVEVTLTSTVRGPLAGVTVLMDESIEAVTNSAGVARFPSAAVGARAITVPQPPDGCTPPASQSASVTASTTTTLAMDITCPLAVLALSPESIDFGIGVTGITGESQTITLTNRGGSASTPISVTITGVNAGDFVLVGDGCTNGALAPSATCTIQLALRPTASGARTATLSATASQGGTSAIALAGSGITPASLQGDVATFNFGAEGIGGTTAARTFTVTNSGGAPTAAIVAAISGDHAGDFSIVTNTCASSLASGEACTVSIAASPTGLDARSAVFTVSSPGAGSANVALTATGLRAAQLGFVDATPDFGVVTLGESITRSFVIENAGAGLSGSLAASVSGANASDFFIVADETTCGPRLGAAARCVVAVRFASAASGNRHAVLTVAGSPGGSVDLALTGRALTPASIAIDRSSHDFGSVVTATSAQATFTVINSGEADATGIAVSVTGGHAADFSRTGGTCAATLPGGSNCTVVLQFAPSAEGQRTATLQVSTTRGGSSSATLVGIGELPPTIAFTEEAFDAGEVVVLSAAALHTFTVTNTGTKPTGALQVSLESNMGIFQLVGSCRAILVLAPGATCTVDARWTPITVGDLSAKIIVTGGVGTRAEVRFTGKALSRADLVFSPAPLEFGEVPVLSAQTKTVTITNAGQAASAPLQLSVGGTSSELTIQSTTCPAAGLAGGASCTATVKFAPAAAGSKTFTVTATGSHSGLKSLTVTGAGSTPPSLSVASGATGAFGALSVGQFKDREVMISNLGTLSTGTLTLATDSPNFAVVSSTCGAEIEGFEACKVVLRYLPLLGGNHTANFTATGAAGGSLSFALSGSATTPPGVAIAAPLEVDFGSIAPNTAVQKTITFTNGGATAASGLSLTLTSDVGPLPQAESAFQIVANNCGLILSGSACQVTLRFKAFVATPQPGAYAGALFLQGPGILRQVTLKGKTQ